MRQTQLLKNVTRTAQNPRSMMGRLLLMTMLLFTFVWGAKAQQALPYSYGFENNDLDAEGWTAQVTSNSSGIYNAGSSTAHGGTNLFRFSYTEQSGYLVSPLLTGTNHGVNLSFFYKEYSASYGDEQFYVGYTTDETVIDPTAFTYGEIVTASTSWQEYTAFLPEGTKRIAIQYVYNDAFYLYLDDFSFEAPGAVAKPTDLTVSGITAYGATLGWTENGTATSWEICINDNEDNLITTTTNPYTFTGLDPQTTYSVKVRSVAGSETSSWSSNVSFTTAEVCPEGKVCIGTGTATNSYIPTYTYYNYSLTQQIYTAEEIGEGGYILSVDFHSSAEKTRTLDIYMVSTDKNSFEDVNDWIAVTAADKVFSGSVTFAAGDWTTIVFDTPFAYDGTSNIALIIDDNTGSYESSPSFYAFSATSQAIRIYSDGTNYDPENPSSYNGTILTQKNRIRLEVGVPPTCPKPRNLAASNVTSHTATLTWTAGGEETQWTVEYGQSEDFTGATSKTVSNNPTLELTGLDAETVYYARVKANCSESDASDWTAAISFETQIACAAPTNVAVSDVEPFAATVSWVGLADNYNLRYRAARGFHYDFETTEAFVVDEFSPCTTYDGDGLPSYGIDGYSMPNSNYVGSVIAFSDNDYWVAHSGNSMGAFMDAIPGDDVTANNDYFITPELTIARGDHFTFWARSVTANYGLERMKVGIYRGDGTISTYFAGSETEYVEVPVDWTKYDYDLSDYDGQAIQLAINCVSADAFALLFDDVFVGDPTDDTWDVTLNNVTSPYTLTGLTDETMYEVQVQSACGGEDGVSEWVDASFTTPSNCAAPTDLAANNITASGATLSWTGFHDNYNVQYRTAESRKTYYFNDFNDKDVTGWNFDGSFIYGFTDPIYNIASDDNYFLEMGWNSTEEETIISCELPAYESGAHVEFYYFGYNTANTFQVGFSTTTNDADAFTWSDPIDAPLSTYTKYNEELTDGIKYVAFKATASEQNASIFIDDFGIFGGIIPAGEWNTATANEATLALTSLNPETKYEWQVQGINPGCDGGVTAWSEMSSFTTVGVKPTDLAVSDITSSTATISWTGYCESYEVYVSPDEPDNLISVDFEDQTIPTDFTNDADHPWTVVEGNNGYCIQSGNAGVASSTSSISITKIFGEDGGTIEFDVQLRGEGTGTVYDKCIFSIDGAQQWAYGAIGEEWYHLGSYVTAGEHTFTWSYTKDSSVNPTGDYFAVDNIVINESNINWATTPIVVTETECALTELTPNTTYYVQVVGVIGENNYESGIVSFTTSPLIILADNEDNSEIIRGNNGKTADVKLADRTLYKDGYWNTLTLPFNVNDLSGTPLAGATLMELNGTTSNLTGTTLTLNFDDATSISAGVPYIIKWADGEDIEDPVFTGVTINKDASTEVSFDGGKFMGTYSPKSYTEETPSILFVGVDEETNESKLYWPNPADAEHPVVINAFRAYFDVADGSKIRAFRLNFGENGGEATGILSMDNGQLRMENDSWYSVDGRKLLNAPKRKGVYIHNGTKVTIK